MGWGNGDQKIDPGFPLREKILYINVNREDEDHIEMRKICLDRSGSKICVIHTQL